MGVRTEIMAGRLPYVANVIDDALCSVVKTKMLIRELLERETAPDDLVEDGGLVEKLEIIEGLLREELPRLS